MVVKVFTLQDQGTNLRGHRDRLLEVRRLLDGCPNCLPFQRACLTERAAFMVRQFVRHSLYDRMSTRPFLTMVEKRWIAFQILLALQQAHKHGVREQAGMSRRWPLSHISALSGLPRRHQDRECPGQQLELGLPHRLCLVQAHLPARGQPGGLFLFLRHLQKEVIEM